jgi:MFS transporter, Spinster family, sphingosine-1-phosphate transporter
MRVYVREPSARSWSSASDGVARAQSEPGRRSRLFGSVNAATDVPWLALPGQPFVLKVDSKNYLLTLLLVILASNHLDRLAFGLVLQNIKVDLALTDTQLGVVTGIAFALFYATMGIPIARWADRGNRVAIISVTAALWSGAVVLCAATTSFIQLLVVRIFAAVGEAGCQPPALSLIADRFTRAERPRAVARYLLGFPLALTLGYLAAGWLNELWGWRTTFVILGAPGLLLAIVAALTLREPRQAVSARDSENVPLRTTQPGLRQVFLQLWSNLAFRHLMFCFAVWSFFGYGILQWQPAFFVRSHGLETGELGTWLAGIYGVGGLVGTYVGGELAARYAANNERLHLKAIAIVFAMFGLMVAVAYIAPDRHLAFAVLAVSALGGAMVNGPLFAATQTLVPHHMRATAIALMFFFANLIGMGLGPLSVGTLSDALRPLLGEESLRYALLAFCPGYFWAAWHAWKCAQHVADHQQLHAPAEAAGAPVDARLLVRADQR